MSNIKWIAAGIPDINNPNKFYASTNGINWTGLSNINNTTIWEETKSMKSKIDGTTRIVAVGNGYIKGDNTKRRPCIYSDDNGQSWVSPSYVWENNEFHDFMINNTIFNSIDSSGRRFVAVGKKSTGNGSSAVLMKSPSGEYWVHEYIPYISNGDHDFELYDVKWTGDTGGWIAVGKIKHNNNAYYIYHSSDKEATNWSPLSWSYGNTYIPKVITTYGTKYYLSNRNLNKIFASGDNWNTTVWTLINTNLSGKIYALINTGSNRVIVGGQDVTTSIKYTNDGTTFIDGANINFYYPLTVKCLALKNNTILAGSDDGRLFISTNTGQSWTIVYTNTNIAFNSIEYVP